MTRYNRNFKFILLSFIIIISSSLIHNGCCNRSQMDNNSSTSAAAAAAAASAPGDGGDTSQRQLGAIYRTPYSFQSPLESYINFKRDLQRLQISEHRPIVTKNQFRPIENTHSSSELQDRLSLEDHQALTRGVSLFRQQDYRGAIAEFNLVLRRFPEDLDLIRKTHQNLAVTYLNMGDNLNYARHFYKYISVQYQLMNQGVPGEDPQD